MDINEIVHQELSVCSNEGNRYTSKYFFTTKFLASCIDEVILSGYDKNSTLTKVKAAYEDNKEPSQKAIQEAKAVITFFKQYDSLDDMLDNFNGNGGIGVLLKGMI